jgi:7-cyano-7-deazaguanine synthase
MRDEVLGANVVDYNAYSDWRREHIEAYEHVANLATKAGVESTSRFHIHWPLIRLARAENIWTRTSTWASIAV